MPELRGTLERVGGDEAWARTWISWYEMTAACRARPSSAISRTFTSTSAAVLPIASKAAASTDCTPCVRMHRCQFFSPYKCRLFLTSCIPVSGQASRLCEPHETPTL